MKQRTTRGRRLLQLITVAVLTSGLSGCSDPQVYGSIGMSTGYGGYGGWNSGVRTSISIGGRIR